MKILPRTATWWISHLLAFKPSRLTGQVGINSWPIAAAQKGHSQASSRNLLSCAIDANPLHHWATWCKCPPPREHSQCAVSTERAQHCSSNHNA